MNDRHVVPAAIVVAGIAIGVGAYFGLRAQAPQAPTGPSTAAAPNTAGTPAGGGEPTTPAPSEIATTLTTTPPAGAAASPEAAPIGAGAVPGSPAAPSGELAAAARKALDQRKATFVAKCWTPHAAAPGPASIHLDFDMTFDANGVEIARGISEDRAASKPEVASCIRLLPFEPLKIPPPGAPAHVVLRLTLP